MLKMYVTWDKKSKFNFVHLLVLNFWSISIYHISRLSTHDILTVFTFSHHTNKHHPMYPQSFGYLYLCVFQLLPKL